LNQRHLGRQNAVAEQARNFGEEARREIGAAFVYGLAHVRADKERVHAAA